MLPPTSISLRCRGPLGNSASGFLFLLYKIQSIKDLSSRIKFHGLNLQNGIPQIKQCICSESSTKFNFNLVSYQDRRGLSSRGRRRPSPHRAGPGSEAAPRPPRGLQRGPAPPAPPLVLSFETYEAIPLLHWILKEGTGKANGCPLQKPPQCDPQHVVLC